MNIINHDRQSFAKTNTDSILQRVQIMQKLIPNVESIGEICCGDCLKQFHIYRNNLKIKTYRGLDIDPIIVKLNKERGISCVQGDALNAELLKSFLLSDILFFGPPLSMQCDGHAILNFDQVNPSFFDFLKLIYSELNYNGIVNCICPRDTTMGDISKLNTDIKKLVPSLSLPLINYSHSNKTGNDEEHELRLKYVELWFSKNHEDAWEVIHCNSL